MKVSNIRGSHSLHLKASLVSLVQLLCQPCISKSLGCFYWGAGTVPSRYQILVENQASEFSSCFDGSSCDIWYDPPRAAVNQYEKHFVKLRTHFFCLETEFKIVSSSQTYSHGSKSVCLDSKHALNLTTFAGPSTPHFWGITCHGQNITESLMMVG